MAATRFPDLMALLCGLLILPWILGVPGHPDTATRLGWTLGLISMVIYLVLYQAVNSLAAKSSIKSNASINTLLCRSMKVSASMAFVLILISFALVLAPAAAPDSVRLRGELASPPTN